MSFTTKIKEEISNAERTKSERLAGLSGYIRNNANIFKDKITMTTENKFIVERVTNGIKDFYNTNSKIDVLENLNFSKKELYQIAHRSFYYLSLPEIRFTRQSCAKNTGEILSFRHFIQI